MSSRRLLAVAVIAGVFVAGVGFSAGATTYGLFSDSEIGSGTIQAADTFDGSPPGGNAWDDKDGDGFYDSDESTYSEEQLYEFNDPSANLVIPDGMGKVKAKNDGVSITAGDINSKVTIESGTGPVSLTATQGDVTVTGSKVKSKNSAVTVITNETLNIADTTIDANDAIDFSADQISAQRSDIKSKNGNVILSATDGALLLDSATVEAPTGNIEFESNGDMSLASATLKTKQGGMITANLTTKTGTLFVDNTDIRDSDDRLIYEPDVTLSGTPTKGCVEHSDGNTVRCA